jgi:hypothetical protein
MIRSGSSRMVFSYYNDLFGLPVFNRNLKKSRSVKFFLFTGLRASVFKDKIYPKNKK